MCRVSNNSIVNILLQFGYTVPMVIVCLVGLILAFQRKRNHPFSATLAIWGFLILLLQTFTLPCVQTVMIVDRSNSGMSVTNYGLLFNAVAVFRVFLSALGVSLL